MDRVGVESAMEPEYDVTDLDFIQEAAADPGVPDELVAQVAADPPAAIAFNRELAAEGAPLLIAAVLAIVLTEVVKPWAKLAMAERKLSEDYQKRIMQSFPFVFGTATSSTFGFREMVIDLTGVALSVAECVAYGGASVGVVALVIYEFVHSVRPIKLARHRLYKLVGVTEAEMETVRGQSPITAEQLAEYRKQQGLADDHNDTR